MFHEDLFQRLVGKFGHCPRDGKNAPDLSRIPERTVDYYAADVHRYLVQLYEEAWSSVGPWRRDRPELFGLRTVDDPKRIGFPTTRTMTALAGPRNTQAFKNALGDAWFQTMRAGIRVATQQSPERYKGINQAISWLLGDAYLGDFIAHELRLRFALLAELVVLVVSVAENAAPSGSPFEIARQSIPLIKLLGLLGEHAEVLVFMTTGGGATISSPARNEGVIEAILGARHSPWGFRDPDCFEVVELDGTQAVRLKQSVLDTADREMDRAIEVRGKSGRRPPINLPWPMLEAHGQTTSVLEELYLAMLEIAEKASKQ
ncbi:MAG: hypothetical protein U0136_14095 [Bdellovibrionota bacterium]